MTAKEYLWQIERWQQKIERIDNDCIDKIDRLNQRIATLYNQATGMKAITYDKDRVQISPQNSLPEIIVLIDEASREYTRAITMERLKADRDIAKLQQKIDFIVSQIESLDDHRFVEVLKHRYLYGKRWEQIAVDMKYAFRHVTRLHGQALAAFASRYKDVLLCPKK